MYIQYTVHLELIKKFCLHLLMWTNRKKNALHSAFRVTG